MTAAETLATNIDRGSFSMRDIQCAADLLRSQAAEIFALKSEVLNKADYAQSMYLMHEASKAEIERLRGALADMGARYGLTEMARAALENKHD